MLLKAFLLWNISCATPRTCPSTVCAMGHISPCRFSTPMFSLMWSLIAVSPSGVRINDQ